MFKKYIAFIAVFILASCGYAVDSTIQEVTFVTPGAYNARCDVYAHDFHYRVNPPETIAITRAREDLEITCLAPGNRRREITIDTKINDTMALNIFNGILPGALWDGASGALYKYPSYIEIDFRHIPAKLEEVPAQNNPDIRQPESYRLEEFNSSSPRLNSDRDVDAPLRRVQSTVQEPQVQSQVIETPYVPEGDSGVVETIDYSGSKSDPDPVAGE